MSSTFDAYLGVADETAYGTAVAPTKFYEFVKEGLAGTYERIESAGIRSGTKVLRADRFVPNPKGASGEIDLEVQSLGFDFWLKYMFGTATTAAGVTTATVGGLKGLSFTSQVNRVDSTGADNIYTYEGGKVTDWEISNSVDGLLMFNLNTDFAKETIGAGTGAYAKSTATFPAGALLLSFLGGQVTIGGTAFAVNDVSLKGDNGLKTDRYFIRQNGRKSEPLESDNRSFEFSLKGEFESVLHAQRVASLTSAGTLASVVMSWGSPDGNCTFVTTANNCRFDDGSVNIDGPGILEQTLTGHCLTGADGSTPLTAVLTGVH